MQPWRPGKAVPAAVDPSLPSTDIRISRNKIFSEEISTRIKVRPQFEEALKTAREIKAHAPHCRVIFTVFEMKRLGRDAAEPPPSRTI